LCVADIRHGAFTSQFSLCGNNSSKIGPHLGLKVLESIPGGLTRWSATRHERIRSPSNISKTVQLECNTQDLTVMAILCCSGGLLKHVMCVMSTIRLFAFTVAATLTRAERNVSIAMSPHQQETFCVPMLASKMG